MNPEIRMMISDVRMPGMTGLEALRELRQRQHSLPVLLVTAYADIRDAVHAMRDGAVNYLEKPIDLDELITSVRNALGITLKTGATALAEVNLPPDIIAQSSEMLAVFREAAMVAQSDTRILITGESGVGKEIISDLDSLPKSACKRPLHQSELRCHSREPARKRTLWA